MNTSFIERLNLTIRQSSAYLLRRTLSHARSKEKLAEHLELLRCYYNFARPHGALKFGRETRTSGDAGWARREATHPQGDLRVHAAILILIENDPTAFAGTRRPSLDTVIQKPLAA